MRESTFLILTFGLIVSHPVHAAKHDMDESNNPPATAKFVDDAAAPEEPLTLWYRKPATKWETQDLTHGNP